MTDERNLENNDTKDSVIQPNQTTTRRNRLGYLGCLISILYMIVTPYILVKWGGWLWWNVVGLALLFCIARIILARLKSSGWYGNHSLATAVLITAIFGTIDLTLCKLDIVQKPLIFDHSTPQRNDLRVMKDVFLNDPPASFKIIKVDWRGVDWFPSQGVRVAEYQVEVDADDLKQLLSKISGNMKPVKSEIPDLVKFRRVMDEALMFSIWDSMLNDNVMQKDKHNWKQYVIKAGDKLETIRSESTIGWDEVPSQKTRIYIHVYPLYF